MARPVAKAKPAPKIGGPTLTRSAARARVGESAPKKVAARFGESARQTGAGSRARSNVKSAPKAGSSIPRNPGRGGAFGKGRKPAAPSINPGKFLGEVTSNFARGVGKAQTQIGNSPLAQGLRPAADLLDQSRRRSAVVPGAMRLKDSDNPLKR